MLLAQETHSISSEQGDLLSSVCTDSDLTNDIRKRITQTGAVASTDSVEREHVSANVCTGFKEGGNYIRNQS